MQERCYNWAKISNAPSERVYYSSTFNEGNTKRMQERCYNVVKISNAPSGSIASTFNEGNAKRM